MKIQKALVIVIMCLSLLLCGCPEYIYVDASNTTSIEDGSPAHPYNTIQEGLDAAVEDDVDYHVWVKNGSYNENVTIKRGTTLRAYVETQAENPRVYITGGPAAPTILSRGDNRVEGFMIQGGSSGIEINLETALELQDRTALIVEDCQINYSSIGINVVTPDVWDFGIDIRKRAFIDLYHNLILNTERIGLQVELVGPRSGSMNIHLDVKDNILEATDTGILLHAIGDGPNPRHLVRTSIDGHIKNNLIIHGRNGMLMEGENLGVVSPFIEYNTIADNSDHGISVASESGPDGYGSTHVNLIGNIIAENGGNGFQEFTQHTSPLEMSYNLFHLNDHHYLDVDSDRLLDTEAELNTPILDGRVVFYSGSGNLVRDPQFVDGEFIWMGFRITDRRADYFLRQDGVITSPAVNAGGISAIDARLSNRTTNIDWSNDIGQVDIGFHYKTE